MAGANKQLSTDDIDKAKEIITSADVIACQLETSSDVAIRAMEMCKGVGRYRL